MMAAFSLPAKFGDQNFIHNNSKLPTKQTTNNSHANIYKECTKMLPSVTFGHPHYPNTPDRA
jgi:hypothetical protein